MYAFAYWHTYYDSLFLHHPFKPSHSLYQDLNISSHLSQWPPLETLPQLPRMLESLQRFILDDANWIGSMCSQDEMELMQRSINTLVLCLKCEKQYGFEFWSRSKRRIQASIVHFVIFVKRFIFAIIPEDCRNLVEAHKADKLSIEMAKIQYFINEIISIMQPIHSFLFGQDFQEEQHLTKSFFQEFNAFIQNLPTIKRSHLIKTPKLMDYICVVNPIEAEGLELHNDDQVRKKSATVLERPKTDNKYSLQKKKRSKNFKVVNNSIVKIREKKHSLEKNIFDRGQQTQNNYQFFKFKDKVRKYSFYNKSKKQTLASIETKEKTASIEKDRSRSHDRSLSISPDVKLKSRTLANDIRGKQESPLINRGSREFTSRSILSRRSRSFRRTDIFQAEEMEHEREEKTKKKKVVKLPIKSQRYSQLINVNEGKVKGWAVIREYVAKKIAERRLKRLLL